MSAVERLAQVAERVLIQHHRLDVHYGDGQLTHGCPCWDDEGLEVYPAEGRMTGREHAAHVATEIARAQVDALGLHGEHGGTNRDTNVGSEPDYWISEPFRGSTHTRLVSDWTTNPTPEERDD